MTSTAVKGARQRTESMAQRLAKQPMSEGFCLWDRGYILGSMRLFIFKAENSPPFQLGPCLEGIAHLLQKMDEGADAKENYGYAAEKYRLIQQPILAEIMLIKGVECTEGTAAALTQINELIKTHDADGKADEMSDSKTKMNLGRGYAYQAELLFAEGQCEAAITAAQMAVKCPGEKPGSPGDRTFHAKFTLGNCFASQGKKEEAMQQYDEVIAMNGNYIAAFDANIPLQQEAGHLEKALALSEQAIAIHPKSSLIRNQAFIMSELGKDTEALAMLDGHIANPPHEETEALFSAAGAATTIFMKAKAAIFADLEKLSEAKECIAKALEISPGDEEALSMKEAIDSASTPA